MALKPPGITGLNATHPLVVSGDLKYFFEFGQLNKELVTDTALTTSADTVDDPDIGFCKYFEETADRVQETFNINAPSTTLIAFKLETVRASGDSDGEIFTADGSGHFYEIDYFSGYRFQMRFRGDFGATENLSSTQLTTQEEVDALRVFAVSFDPLVGKTIAIDGVIDTVSVNTTNAFSIDIAANIMNSVGPDFKIRLAAIAHVDRVMNNTELMSYTSGDTIYDMVQGAPQYNIDLSVTEAAVGTAPTITINNGGGGPYTAEINGITLPLVAQSATVYSFNTPDPLTATFSTLLFNQNYNIVVTDASTSETATEQFRILSTHQFQLISQLPWPAASRSVLEGTGAVNGDYYYNEWITNGRDINSDFVQLPPNGNVDALPLVETVNVCRTAVFSDHDSTGTKYWLAAIPGGAGEWTLSGTAPTPEAPVVTAPPQPATIIEDSAGTTTLSVTVTGVPSPSLQWQKDTRGDGNFVDIPGASSATYVITNNTVTVADNNGDQYRVVAANSQGTVTSSAAVITVITIPLVTNLTILDKISNRLRFTVATTVAEGTLYAVSDLSSNLTGITGDQIVAGDKADDSDALIAFTPVAASSAVGGVVTFDATGITLQSQLTYGIAVVHRSPAGDSTVVAANYSIDFAPVITTQPASQQITQGFGSVTFTSAANGNPTPTIQWQKDTRGDGNFVDVSGATSANLTVQGSDVTIAVNNGDRYRVLYNNSQGVVISNIATLSVQAVSTAPIITSQPQAASIVEGQGSTTFSAAAAGSPTPTVQWQKDTRGDGNFVDVSGATSVTLSIQGSTVTTAANNGDRYRAVFTNASGSAISNPAILTVQNADTGVRTTLVNFQNQPIVSLGNISAAVYASFGGERVSAGIISGLSTDALGNIEFAAPGIGDVGDSIVVVYFIQGPTPTDDIVAISRETVADFS